MRYADWVLMFACLSCFTFVSIVAFLVECVRTKRDYQIMTMLAFFVGLGTLTLAIAASMEPYVWVTR